MFKLFKSKISKLILVLTLISIIILGISTKLYFDEQNKNLKNLAIQIIDERWLYVSKTTLKEQKRRNEFVVNNKDWFNPIGYLVFVDSIIDEKDDIEVIQFNFERVGFNSYQKKSSSQKFTQTDFISFEETVKMVKDINFFEKQKSDQPVKGFTSSLEEPTLEELKKRKEAEEENASNAANKEAQMKIPVQDRIASLKRQIEVAATCLSLEEKYKYITSDKLFELNYPPINETNKDKEYEGIKCTLVFEKGYEFVARLNDIVYRYEKFGVDPLQ